MDSVENNKTNRTRTSLEKVLIASTGVLVITCSVLVISVAFITNSQPMASSDVIGTKTGAQIRVWSDGGENDTSCYSNANNTCLTGECVNIAYNLMQHMDKSVDPCDNFYQYACGLWADVHPLPDDAVYYDTFAVLKQNTRLKIKKIMEENIHENDSSSMVTVKNFYTSCMNESLIHERGAKPLLLLLQDLGGWPVINSTWSEESFNWVKLMGTLRKYNNDILVSEGIGPDKRNSSLHVIQIDQSRLGMPVIQYFITQGRHYKAYLQYMVETAVLLGANRSHAEVELTKVAEFETRLANITMKEGSRRNINQMYKKLSLRKLQKEVPQIDWLAYFNTFMPVQIDENEMVVSFAMEYFKKLGELVSLTDSRVLANYLLWRFVFNRNFNLDERFQKIQMEYYKVLYGSSKPPPRWMKCTSYVNKNMGMAVGAAFVKHHFSEGSKEKAEEMISEIKSVFLELLDDANWMNKESKKAAKDKVNKVTEKIGYPDFIMNRTLLDEFYSEYEIHPDTFFENVISNLQIKSRFEHSKYNTTVDRTKWMTSPADVNAYYTRTQNMISFPAGILQPPLYSQHYLKALNYGGIGVVIGHEITHGFDDKGRQFDEDGNLNQWWHSSVVNSFLEQAECFINQYDNYTVKQVNITVNGVRTVGENIADNGGVKLAFMAYRELLRRNKEEVLLPGMNMTSDQLFFLNYAQVWCGSGRTEAMAYKLRTGVHTPGQFRVIGSLTNFDEFSKAFNCPVDSPMNPTHKCVMW